MLTKELILYKKVAGSITPTLINPDNKRLLALLGEFIALYRTAIGENRKTLEERLAPLFLSYRRTRLLKGLHKMLLDRATFEVPIADLAEKRLTIFHTAARELQSSFHRTVEEYRGAVFRSLGEAEQAAIGDCFSDLPAHQILTSFQDIEPKELLADYNRVLLLSFDKWFKSR